MNVSITAVWGLKYKIWPSTYELDFDKVQYIIAGKEKFKTLDSAVNWAIAFTHSVAI